MLLFIMDIANPEERSSKYKFLNSLNLDQNTESRLTNYLDSVVRGNSNVLMTPTAVDWGPTTILKEWDEIYKSNNTKINSVLNEYELSERAKFGPRSIMKPWKDRYNSVLDYYKPKKGCISKESIKDVILKYKTNDLRPLSPTNALKLLKNNTNAGLPEFVSKSKVKPTLVSKYREELDQNYPCILFTRTQENNKTRNVWGYPAALTLLEMQYYKPILDLHKTFSWRKALLGPDEVNNTVSDYLTLVKHNPELTLISADFTAYDASVSPRLINMAFEFICNEFQRSNYIDLYYIRSLFTNVPLLTPSCILRGSHGIPSGSTFTNEVGSIIQYLVTMSSNIVHDDRIQVQGDDGLYIINDKDGKIDDLTNLYAKIGLQLNDKTVVAKDHCIYLRNLYHTDYKDANGRYSGIYPIYRALNKILYQERFTDIKDIGLSGQDYFSLRTISILENCKCHPLFKDFVKFIRSKDKYLLAYTQKGLSKFKELHKDSSGAEGIIKNRYGDDLSGIDNFETMKILRNFNN